LAGWLASFRLRDKFIAALLLLYQVCLPVQVIFLVVAKNSYFHMKKKLLELGNLINMSQFFFQTIRILLQF
jgi:hypothetical protein